MSEAAVTLFWLIVIAETIAISFCVYWLWRLKNRFRYAFGNLDSKADLALTIIDYFKKLGATAKKLNNLEKSYQHLSDIGARSIQKMGMVRFNPFPDTGGDQSFVLALLDNHDSGFLMTSIHGREGTRIYIKPVEYGRSKHTLSKEEEAALKAAQKPAAKETK